MAAEPVGPADLSERLSNRIQLTTDGHGAYPNAVGLAFRHNIDFTQLVKQYATDRSVGPLQPAGLHRRQGPRRPGQP